MENPSNHHSNDSGSHHHFVMPDAMALKIWGALLCLTLVTVAVAKVDLGGFWNLIIALAVATVKASLVALFFMGLKYDHKENVVIFLGSFIFVAIFIILTLGDVFSRPSNYQISGPFFSEVSSGAPKFKRPWVSQEDVRANGKALFDAQCVSCHGASGKGDGPAAGALNPPPRNFTSGDAWKNGRKPSQVFTTLTKGLNSMPAFASLGAEDRWSLAHFVLSLGPTPPADSNEDLKSVGIDPSADTLSSGGEKAISVDQAIDAITESP